MFAVLRNTVIESGVRSLYTGLSAAILRQMTYSMVRLSSYDRFKAMLAAEGRTSPGELLAAAMAAGALGGMAGNPAGVSRSIARKPLDLLPSKDIMVVRMTSDSVRPPQSRYNYSNVFHGLSDLVKREGANGLTRGLGTNLVSSVYFSRRNGSDDRHLQARAVLMNVRASFTNASLVLTTTV